MKRVRECVQSLSVTEHSVQPLLHMARYQPRDRVTSHRLRLPPTIRHRASRRRQSIPSLRDARRCIFHSFQLVSAARMVSLRTLATLCLPLAVLGHEQYPLLSPGSQAWTLKWDEPLDGDATGNLIFNSLASLLQMKPNSRYRVGV